MRQNNTITDPATYQMLRDESKRNRLYTNQIACISIFCISFFLFQKNDANSYTKFKESKIETTAHHISSTSSIQLNTYKHIYQYSDRTDRKHTLLVEGQIYPVNSYGRKSHKISRLSTVSKNDKQIRVFYPVDNQSEGISFKTDPFLRSIYLFYIINRLGLFIMFISGFLCIYISKKIIRLEYRIKKGYRNK